MTSRPDQVLSAFLGCMAQASVACVLMGGYAVVTWGIPRATFDIDLLVDVDANALDRLAEALELHGFAIDAAYRAGWRDRVRDMPLIKVQMFRDGRAISCDLFPVTTPLQTSAFARAVTVQLPGVAHPVRVVSPADLVLFKLLADRPKDRLDVQNILTVQGLPDPAYLREFASRLGIADRLSAAITLAGL